MNWVLDAPVYLTLLLLMPLLIWVRHLRPRRAGRVRVPFSIPGGPVHPAPMTARGLWYRVSVVTFWAAFVSLVVAMSGPARTERERIILSRGMDIMLVLDQSASMAAADFQPGNRFETARAVIRRFVEQRPDDHIGLVGFSQEAEMRVPPTRDHGNLIDSLDRMQLLELGDGTAIGMGVTLAALHLQSGEAQDRVIVLLTDGVNNAGEISPQAAAEAAAELGITIFAVGVGSDREAAIEVLDPNTGELYRGTVADSYDEDTLRAMAERSGGQFFSAGSVGALQTVFEALSTVQTGERRSRIRVVKRPVHRVFMQAGFALLLATVLIRRLYLGVAP